MAILKEEHSDRVEQVQQIPDERKEEYLGSLRLPSKNHKLWKMDKATKEVSEAQIDEVTVGKPVERTVYIGGIFPFTKSAPQYKKKLNPRFQYCSALNKKTALKKFGLK